MPLATGERVRYPTDRSLSYSLGRVFSNDGEAPDIIDTSQAETLHAETFRRLYDDRAYLNVGGEHYAEVNVSANFLIKRLRALTQYGGDFAVEFVAGSDYIEINGEQIYPLRGIDGTWVEVEGIVGSITREAGTIKVRALASGALSDSNMTIDVEGYQL